MNTPYALEFLTAMRESGARGGAKPLGIDWALPLRTGGCFPAWNHRSAVFSSISIPGKSANWQDGTAFHPPSSRLGGGTQRFFLAFGFFAAAGGGLGGRRGGSREGRCGLRDGMGETEGSLGAGGAHHLIQHGGGQDNGGQQAAQAFRKETLPQGGQADGNPRLGGSGQGPDTGAPPSARRSARRPGWRPRICRGSARRNRSRRSPRRSGGRECSAAGRTARKRAAEWAG